MQKESSSEWPQSHEQPQDPITPSLSCVTPVAADDVFCKLPQQERDYRVSQVSFTIAYSLLNNKLTMRGVLIYTQKEQNIHR